MKKFSTIRCQSLVFCAGLLALCCLRGIPPLTGFCGTTGPYWIVFLLEIERNQLSKALITETLKMQREFSAENKSTIARNLNSNFSNTPGQTEGCVVKALPCKKH